MEFVNMAQGRGNGFSLRREAVAEKVKFDPAHKVMSRAMSVGRGEAKDSFSPVNG